MTSPTGPNSRNVQSAGRVNSLGLGQAALDALIKKLETPAPGAGKHDAKVRRQYIRWPFRKESITLRVSGPTWAGMGSAEVQVRVACRNISKGGMSVLHNSFLHTGTRLVVELPPPPGAPEDEPPRLIPAQIVRCQHRGGVVHELGIKFDEQLDVRAFVERDPFDQRFSVEALDLTRVMGTLVHVTRSPLEQRAVESALKGARVRIRAFATAEDAAAFNWLGLAPAGNADPSEQAVLVCDLDTEGSGPADVLSALCMNGFNGGRPGPLIVLCEDTGLETRRKIATLLSSRRSQRCDEPVIFLVKPIEPQKLVKAVAECLLTMPPEEQPKGKGGKHAA